MAHCRATTVSIALIGSGGRTTPHRFVCNRRRRPTDPLLRRRRRPIHLRVRRRQTPTHLVLRYCWTPNRPIPRCRRSGCRHACICSRILNHPPVTKTPCGSGGIEGTDIGAAARCDEALHDPATHEPKPGSFPQMSCRSVRALPTEGPAGSRSAIVMQPDRLARGHTAAAAFAALLAQLRTSATDDRLNGDGTTIIRAFLGKAVGGRASDRNGASGRPWF